MGFFRPSGVLSSLRVGPMLTRIFFYSMSRLLSRVYKGLACIVLQPNLRQKNPETKPDSCEMSRSRVRSVLCTINNIESNELEFPSYVKSAVWQRERGASGTEHLQLCMQFKNQIDFHKIKQFLPTAHIEPCKDYRKAYNYCRKSDSRIDGPWYYGELVASERKSKLDEFIQSLEENPNLSKLGVLKSHPEVSARHPQFCKEFISEVKSDARSKLEELDEAQPWQIELVKLVQSEPDRRTVHWYWSEAGGTGKTKTATYLQDCFNAFVIDIGKTSDVAYSYDFEKIVIFDLPRVMKDELFDHVYYLCEKFKDGRLFSPKYESKIKKFNPPHVIVFCNREPEYCKMSSDRWHVECID